METEVAKAMSVEEAMKVLNMKKFNADELNKKFRFRVQSVAQGLGGPLKAQKEVYKAWEYLNRMLARESSTNTESLLRKADKTIKMGQKPKRLDMIPIKFKNPARRASLVIEKSDKKNDKKKEVKSILKVREPLMVRGQLPPLHAVIALESVKAKTAGKSSKRVKWKDEENFSRAGVGEVLMPFPSGMLKAKLNARSLSKPPVLVKRESEAFTQTVVDKTRVENEFKDYVKKMLPKLMGGLPKLKQKMTFKRVAGLNEIFASPKKLSRHEVKAVARRVRWKEELSRTEEETDVVERKRLPPRGKPKSILKARKPLQKQEDVHYKEPPDPSTDSSVSKWKPDPSRGLRSNGPYTPSRINNWMESSEQLNPE